MAPKKKGVSFVKVDKIPAESTAANNATTKSKTAVVAASKAKQAKKETTSNTTAVVAAVAAAPAGKKKETKPETTSTTATSVKKAPKKLSKKDKKKCAPYVALQLRNLPDAFQEPQIRKFFAQFGVPIAQSFVQRTKKRAASRGLAYVRFAPKDDAQEKLMDVIFDECRAMNLGGKTVTAKWVTMSRMMPSRKATDARRQIEYENKTLGVPLERHNVAHFNWVQQLKNGAQTEGKANKFLKSVGIDYAFGGFAKQVPLLSKEVRVASNAAAKSVKLSRLATAIGRRKGFGNEKVLKKVLDKKRAKRKAQRQRKADKKKAGKVSSAGAAAAASPVAAEKKVAAAAAGKKK